MHTTPDPAAFLTAAAYDDEPDIFEEIERRLSELESRITPRDLVVGGVDMVDTAAAVEDPTAGPEDGADWLSEQLADEKAQHGAVLELVDEIRRIVAPSTSKVSLAVKAAIEAWANPQVEAPLVEAQEEVAAGARPPGALPQPAHDAHVGAWGDYAESLGYSTEEIAPLNKSQIRTLLGVEQPVAVQ